MSTHQAMRITLPVDIAAAVKSKVDSGEYASESEVLLDGVRALLAHDKAVEHWLHTDVAKAYDALKGAPSSAVPIEQIQKNIAARCTKRYANA